MEVMKDVSILFYRDKCFFSAVKYLYLYHSSWLVHIDVSGQTIKLLQNIYHKNIFGTQLYQFWQREAKHKVVYQVMISKE